MTLLQPPKPQPSLPSSSGLIPPLRSAQVRTSGQSYRSIVLIVILTLTLFGLLGSRLAYLQLVRSGYFQQLADTNRIRLIPSPPERGRILDRNGVLLAGNQLSHAIYIWPLAQPKQAWLELIPQLAQILDLPATEIQQRLEQAGYRSPFPVRIMRNISPAMVIQLEELNTQMPGVIVEAETVRYYPNGDLAAHVLGYTGEITTEQLQARRGENYRLGDTIGQMGVEDIFEPLLRGQWGGRQVEVDAAGEVIRVLGEQQPLPGQTVTLTLDLKLQQVAEQALGQRKGAVVAMDPRTGGILAMASYPTFDPNIFSSHISQEQWNAIQQQQFPFLNRAIRSYAPASTFKIITTAAALESGTFPPGTVLATAPYINVGGRKFWDWNRAGFGPLGFEQAMAYSSDTFFYQIALKTSATPIQVWSRRFGLGQLTGIGLAGESQGLIPDEAWKQKVWEEPWYVGDTVNMSIGQGFVTATPLQMAIATAAVANGGWRVRPLLSYHSPEPGVGPIIDAAHPDQALPHQEWVGLSETTLKILQEGLRQVISRGTGQGVALPYGYPNIAGKSGTAEDQPRPNHTWFVAYGPWPDPEVVVVAFLENSGGGGSQLAGPICRTVLQAYFQP